MNNPEMERLSLYNEILEARVTELKEERDTYDAETQGYLEVIQELQKENKNLRAANVLMETSIKIRDRHIETLEGALRFWKQGAAALLDELDAL